MRGLRCVSRFYLPDRNLSLFKNVDIQSAHKILSKQRSQHYLLDRGVYSRYSLHGQLVSH